MGNAKLLENYTSCVTIEGNLRIQLIEYNESKPDTGLPNLVQVSCQLVTVLLFPYVIWNIFSYI